MKQNLSTSASASSFRNLLPAILLIGCALAPRVYAADTTPASATQPAAAAPRIAVIDLDKTLGSLDMWKDTQARIQQDNAAAQQKISALDAEITRLKAELAYFKEDSRDYQDRKTAINVLQQQLIQQTNQAAQRLRDQTDDARQSARTLIATAAKQYALEHNLDIVLDIRAALYAARAADISMEVARELNKRYKESRKVDNSEAPEPK